MQQTGERHNNDQTLLNAHREGDGQAFALLVRQHGPMLMGYLTRMCRDNRQAEDCFQETFLRVHTAAASFSGTGSFKAWLYTIASNVVMDLRRKQLRRPTLVSSATEAFDDDCPEPVLMEPADTHPGPVETIARRELRACVLAALEQLPHGQRAALVMSYYQGLSYRQIGEVMHCSVSTVKTQVFRALKRLATLLPDVDKARL
ncbi:MAG: sigma-70 family RNA polymerase sigma factor [Sedimentisphaerales bacterium]|nr:sigma-70 family RNA polymerase sigma factor [Sedimentisphaerales bacterium]